MSRGERTTSPWLRIGARALVIGVACYVGATIGNAMRFPHLGTAIVYPPYAVVAAALMLSPSRHWWIYLLASSAGTTLAHRAGGEPTWFVLLSELDYQAVAQDITERRRADEQRRLLQAQQALAEALRVANRRKDEFLALLAHELRNPLSAIAMAIELLRHTPSTDERLGQARRTLDRQTAKITRLVEDLLDIARMSSVATGRSADWDWVCRW